MTEGPLGDGVRESLQGMLGLKIKEAAAQWDGPCGGPEVHALSSEVPEEAG